MRVDVVVVGAGPWGLAIAREAARRGASVAVIDDGRPPAGWVAAGMIAPSTEARDGEEALAEAMRASAAEWPAFAERLEADSDEPVGLTNPGTLVLAVRPEHRAEVRHDAARVARLGAEPAWRTGSRLRDIEPSLAAAVAGGFELPGEGQVDPRRLLAALGAALDRLGAPRVSGTARLLRRDGRVAGVAVADGPDIEAAATVVAAGWSASALSPEVPVRPVKGEILRLAAPGDQPPFRHMIRTPDVYLVPRPGGEVVVGATMLESSDRAVRAGAVARLLEDAIAVVPDVREMALREASTGLRPATPDGAPAIGRGREEGLVWAVGGYRHGILLTPFAAVSAADLIERGAGVTAFDPARFAGRATCA